MADAQAGASKSRHVQVEIDSAICTIRLNRPERRNAITPDMADALLHALQVAQESTDVRCIILTGADPAFCAGADVALMEQRAQEQRDARGRLRSLKDPMRQIPVYLQETLEKPVIAAINGDAVGWGCGLALACDIRIAAEEARFGEVFVRRGVPPDGGATYLLPRLIGVDRACELIFTGRLVDARTAMELRLVTRLVPRREVMPAAQMLASEIVESAPLAVQVARRMIYAQRHCGFRDAMEQVAHYLGVLRQSEDHEEAVRAFLERRPPKFQGR